MILAATNRPQVLDPAVRRPGRLDREIDVGELAINCVYRIVMVFIGIDLGFPIPRCSW